MSDTRDFTPAEIVCALDGKLIVPVGRIHELLDWMTGEPLMTHQLPRAMDECEPSLRAQHPDLAAVIIPDGMNTWDAVKAYGEKLAAEFGATRPVAPLQAEDHTSINPLTELRMMRPDAEIITVAPGDIGESDA